MVKAINMFKSTIILFILTCIYSCNKDNNNISSSTKKNIFAINGFIIDKLSNDIIKNANIILKKNNYQIAYIQSNETGEFNFNNIDTGKYKIIVTKQGLYIKDSSIVDIINISKLNYTINFLLLPANPVLKIDFANQITDTSCAINYSVKAVGEKKIFDYGLCWDTLPNADITVKKTKIDSIIITGNFCKKISNLNPNTQYYAKLYTITDSNVYYSNEISFKTNNMHVLQEKSALLIIDIQNGIFPIYNQEKVIQNVNLLINKARNKNVPIIFFQFNDDYNFQSGSYGWKIFSDINITNNDIVIQKYYQNSFVSTNLKNILNDKKITNVYISGLQSQYCVKETCIGAINYNFNVILVKDAHSTTNSNNAQSTIININNQMLNIGCKLLTTNQIIF